MHDPKWSNVTLAMRKWEGPPPLLPICNATRLRFPLAQARPSVVGYPVLALGLLVGVSRCYLGVHYPGDVLAGWTLAAGDTARSM